MSLLDPSLLKTPLHALHLELGARMVPFAGYAMPVQYPAGVIAEHLHTRAAAGLFDVSHMGQLRLVGPDAGAAFESLMPVDVIDLPVGKQRYGLLLNQAGGIIDDLMFVNRDAARGGELFVVVNGACKTADIAHLRRHIGERCDVIACPERALLALQGPAAARVLQRLCPDVERLLFMSGADFELACTDQGQTVAVPCFITRSGYTGEDGFEISVHADQAMALARSLLAHAEVKPVGLGARNSLRLEAGLCLHGNDIDANTTPVQASLAWAISKVRRSAGARAGRFPGADIVLAQLAGGASGPQRLRVGLRALERVPVREPSVLQDAAGNAVGAISSGLLAPSVNHPIAMAYVQTAFSAPGTRLAALVRGKPVSMEVVRLPFIANRYVRG